jgi:diacylglycerol kinase (ATP)
MEKLTVIANPTAAKGKVGKMLTSLEEMLRASGLEYSLVLTKARGDAIELARTAQTRNVVALGGDGTINEIANGIVGTEKRMGIIPAGSGNDFIKSVGISSDVRTAISRLHNPETRRVDVGTVACSEDTSQMPPYRLFTNGVGVGFDAAVAERTLKLRWLTGTALYLVAVLQTLRSYDAPEFSVRLDEETWKKRHLLVAIGNGRCAGGGFFLTPEAVVDDGVFDVTAIEQIPILKILRLMPRVMLGKLIQDPALRYLRTKWLEMKGDRPFMVHADGEIVGRNVTVVRVGMHKEKLNLLV